MSADQKVKRAKRPHITLPRLPIVTQIYLWGLAALGILLILSSLSAWLIIDAQAYSDIDSETSDALDSFQAELTDDTNALVLFGKWLATPSNTALFEKSATSVDAAKALQTLMGMQYLDFIIITDEHGHVIARTGMSGISNPSNNLAASTDISDALAGRMNLRTEVDSAGQLSVKLALPRYSQIDSFKPDGISSNPSGAISLGFYVDDEYLKSVKKKASFDMGLIVISKDQLNASKLTSRGASPQMAQLSTGNTNLDEGAFNGTHLVLLNTNHGPYLYKFRPLAVPSRSNSIVIGSGMPTSLIDAEHFKWFKTFALWLIFGLVDLAIVGFFISRSFTQPLRELSNAIVQMSNGNLANRIVLRRDDELGDLAVQLENMRKGLGQKVAELTFEKNGLSTAIGALAVPVVITDAQNRIAVANRAAEALIGYSTLALAGRAWHTLFKLPEGVETPNTPVWRTANAMESRSLLMQERLILTTGEQPILDVKSSPIHIDAELIGYIHTLQDVSEYDRFVKNKNEFLLSVAHELQGPLASWRASIDLLFEDYFEMSRNELGMMLRTLQKTVVRFQGLVEALVDMGKLEAGKFRIQPVPILYGKLVEDSLAQIEAVLKVRGQKLQITLGTPPHSRVMADRARISQVIINLVRNASKYSPEGEPIIVETYSADGQVYFQVTDQGNGISPEEQTHIFERYYRSKRVEEEGSGIGLGLALAKAIIEAHGGQIGVSSELGKGSTFWFTLSEIAPETKAQTGDLNESVDRGR
jgi:PAS domain S-box-containing protein